MSDYDELVAGLRLGFNSGKTRDIAWRIRQLQAFDRMLVENEAALLSALKTDLNKPQQEAVMAEIDFCRNEILGLLRNIRAWTRPQAAEASPLTLLDQVSTVPEPYGVCLVIGAWNFPVQLSLAPALPALAAGNCVLIKPSEISAATAAVMAEIVPRYLDPDCVTVVQGGVPETTALLNQRFDYIFYTGSPTVGRIIGKAAAAQLTPCTLELGGKSPAYIDNSVDLEVAVKRLLWGKCQNAGQVCIAPDFLLCSGEVEKAILPIMQRVLEGFYTSRPADSPDYCRIVSERHYSRLAALLTASKGKVALGGETETETRYMAPTILTGVTAEDPVMQEEIFGPILPVVRADSPAEAIALVNSRPKPLALYVFTEKKAVREMFLNQTSSGGLLFNDTLMHAFPEQLPFGGVGESGMGAYHGKHGFDTFTHYKVTIMAGLD